MKPFNFLHITFLLAFSLGCSEFDHETEIKLAFQNWQQTQIDKREFVNESDCNHAYVNSHPEQELIWGFPDEVNFIYGDLNGDKVEDALITFYPEQCDGGNLMAWYQYKVLVLSAESGFSVNDSIFERINLENESGFYHLDSMDNEFLYGTYFDFKEDDGYCCPSIKRPIRIDIGLETIEIIATTHNKGKST